MCAASLFKPFPFIRLTASMRVPTPTSTFFGSHPRSWQVPPNGRESLIATDQPALRHLKAAADAAAPVPITMRSNFRNYSPRYFWSDSALEGKPASVVAFTRALVSVFASSKVTQASFFSYDTSTSDTPLTLFKAFLTVIGQTGQVIPGTSRVTVFDAAHAGAARAVRHITATTDFSLFIAKFPFVREFSKKIEQRMDKQALRALESRNSRTETCKCDALAAVHRLRLGCKRVQDGISAFPRRTTPRSQRR